jgi:non-canonical purine NTP pyrophosphatase (RdgB/HAM1 family)
MSAKILLATRNAKKLVELQRILDRTLGTDVVHLIGLAEVPEYPEAPETGLTFAENALLKAREGARYTDLPAIADDSGLAVDALNGMPGVFSARWSGGHGDDKANLDLVLAQIGDVPDEHRGAAFVCAVAASTSSRAARPAACCAGRAARAGSVTTRSSSARARTAPTPSSRPRTRTRSATAARRCARWPR